MKITFLGTGTSQGVPVIGCSCEVCKSNNSKDKRLRSSIHIKDRDLSIVIDTGPDFRQQALRSKIDNLDAVVFTHEHKDHIAGLDDVRPYNYQQQKDMEVFANKRVIEALKREYHYAFAETKYPGVPNLNINEIDLIPFKIEHLELIPIEVLHHKLPVLGFRINNFTYITDANFISEENLNKIFGTEILVINALRISPHISHFNLEEAIEMVKKINPKKAYFTHISHLLGTYDEISLKLPEHIELAWDQLELDI